MRNSICLLQAWSRTSPPRRPQQCPLSEHPGRFATSFRPSLPTACPRLLAVSQLDGTGGCHRSRARQALPSQGARLASRGQKLREVGRGAFRHERPLDWRAGGGKVDATLLETGEARPPLASSRSGAAAGKGRTDAGMVTSKGWRGGQAARIHRRGRGLRAPHAQGRPPTSRPRRVTASPQGSAHHPPLLPGKNSSPQRPGRGPGSAPPSDGRPPWNACTPRSSRGVAVAQPTPKKSTAALAGHGRHQPRAAVVGRGSGGARRGPPNDAPSVCGMRCPQEVRVPLVRPAAGCTGGRRRRRRRQAGTAASAHKELPRADVQRGATRQADAGCATARTTPPRTSRRATRPME